MIYPRIRITCASAGPHYSNEGTVLGLAAMSGSLMHRDIWQYAGWLSQENPYSLRQWEAVTQKRSEDAGHGHSKTLISNVTRIRFQDEAEGAQRGRGNTRNLSSLKRNRCFGFRPHNKCSTSSFTSLLSLSLSLSVCHTHTNHRWILVNSFKLLQAVCPAQTNRIHT